MSFAKVLVILELSGKDTFDVSKVTRMIGVDPDQTWHKGDLIQGTSMRCQTNSWLLKTEQAGTLDCGVIVDSMMKCLEPFSAKIAAVGRQQGVDEKLVKIIAYITEQTPSMRISAHSLNVMAKIGAELDVDLILTE